MWKFYGRVSYSILHFLFRYVMDTHGDHPAFYKVKVPGKSKRLPVYYIYDSYHTTPVEWQLMLDPKGSSKHNVRGGPLDGVFLGLVVRTILISRYFPNKNQVWPLNQFFSVSFL